MKSTPEQLAARHELKRLVEIFRRVVGLYYQPTAKLTPGSAADLIHDFQYRVSAIPAIDTAGIVHLQFFRRVTRKHIYLRANWKPEYAATKPESVAELIPVVKTEIRRLHAELKRVPPLPGFQANE